MEAICKEQMSTREIGGTCLFFYMLDQEKNYFGYHSIRIDNDHVDPVLREFLNEHFPSEGQETSNYDVPSIG
jgi:hypothetical protein